MEVKTCFYLLVIIILGIGAYIYFQQPSIWNKLVDKEPKQILINNNSNITNQSVVIDNSTQPVFLNNTPTTPIACDNLNQELISKMGFLDYNNFQKNCVNYQGAFTQTNKIVECNFLIDNVNCQSDQLNNFKNACTHNYNCTTKKISCSC